MAFAITTDSDIIAVGETTKYLNSDDFGSKLFFTDTVVENYYYFTMSLNELGQYEVKNSGMFKGHYYNGKYEYRYDFDRLINIQNQDTPVLTEIITDEVYSIDGVRTSQVLLFISTDDILQENIDDGFLYVTSTGRILDDGVVTFDNYTYEQYFDIDFVDATEANVYDVSPDIAIGQYFSASVMTGTTLLSVALLNQGGVFGDYNLSGYPVAFGSDFKTFFINVPVTEVIIGARMTYQTGVEPSFDVDISRVQGCNTYFNYSMEGTLVALNCSGNAHNVETTEKNYITISDKQYIKDITTNKQIKQNVGFKLEANQIYTLFKSPLVYKLEDLVFDKYLIDNSTFEGYNGSNLSTRNFELILSKDKPVKRRTNFNINFFD